MATSEARTGIALRLERTYQASPERVFNAWVRPDALAQWFAPSAEYKAVITVLEAHAGGRYRIEMHHQGGKVHVVWGVYRELSPPTRIVMTWAWEGQEVFGHTLVTVEMTPRGTGTHLLLLHEQFPNDAARAEHEKGWTGCLERLAPALANAR